MTGPLERLDRLATERDARVSLARCLSPHGGRDWTVEIEWGRGGANAAYGIGETAEQAVAQALAQADARPDPIGEPAAHTGGEPTEQIAARATMPRASSLRGRILEHVARRDGQGGSPTSFLRANPAERETSVRPRFSELKRGGWLLAVTGAVAVTESGAPEQVYIVTRRALQVLVDDGRLPPAFAPPDDEPPQLELAS